LWLYKAGFFGNASGISNDELKKITPKGFKESINEFNNKK
jgi:hypothetical protein